MLHPKLPRNSRGFTLTELMVVTAIASIMVGMGYSGFESMQRRERVTAAANVLVGHLKEARMLALEKHQSHRLIFSGNQYTLCPWDGISDFDTASNPIIQQVNLSQDFPGVSIQSPAPANFRFDIKGLPKLKDGGFAAMTITLTQAQVRTCLVTISNLGRVDVSSCADL
jgi:prepilin-type N-terminal cleavage/methylation domain-containing protein